MIQQFSTGISDKKRKRIILNSVIRLIEKIIQEEFFDEKQPLEIILFTSSDKTLKVFKEYKDSHIISVSNTFLQLKVIYLFQNREPEEIVMF